ncbi:S-ribosylhomocysteine lyase [Shewanella sp. VB17]|uniref:S-ribosylhomocysteine lyase n=1 Tax=Shewanella sp. VB17 TaxID=2739432 RepID=UPI0015664DC3|nr:S-ribosylhomocysteine lyase [Shewanella sp. VB17]NRD75202.1 S-ribosylhomocysteine lyase [Shewanella sp. VB17]
MALLDSFPLGHSRMNTPAVSVAKTIKTPSGDTITVFDLRFCMPNKDTLSQHGIETLDRLYGGFMRHHLNDAHVEIIDISPMGCRTGFYMSLIGSPCKVTVADAWLVAMNDVLTVTKPVSVSNDNSNNKCCFDSLDQAQQIARAILASGISVNSNDELKLS